MLNDFSSIFQILVFTYTMVLTCAYILLAIFGTINTRNYKWKYTAIEDKLLNTSPRAPGISVIAPAYNEETTIVTNVYSMLTLEYPLYEVIIVNDGSKDKTLDLLIREFDLEETPYLYIEKVKTKPFKRIFKSRNEKFSNLTIVDKENGGTKADASNAGINVAMHPYFLCTDVDCILSRDALTKMIQPILNSAIPVIAVGASMRMSNSCEVNSSGVLMRARPPKSIIPCFQEIEYLRSYVVSKMGWAYINATPNVSGGIGLFDKSVVIEAGGYDPLSHAEDVDMLLRMIQYMRNFDKKYKVLHVPVTTCWTEGPPSISVLNKQRTRWARGLIQLLIVHSKLLFNKDYGRVGLVLMPFILLFEFLAPIIEGAGFLTLLYLLFTGQINTDTVWIIFLFIYSLGITISSIAIISDMVVQKVYLRFREYSKLFFFSLFEVILYHPLIVLFSLKGYFDFLSKQNLEWGAMKRQGFTPQQKKTN